MMVGVKIAIWRVKVGLNWKITIEKWAFLGEIDPCGMVVGSKTAIFEGIIRVWLRIGLKRWLFMAFFHPGWLEQTAKLITGEQSASCSKAMGFLLHRWGRCCTGSKASGARPRE
ncbi:MAG: hypothetical protein B7Z37_28845 [Verrucomicrobia bacterium 12-59-8]|nr:MAG: hypothetical protein B7Z37_28845 [Verrucomicrobia bacterium 12-59-8]